MACFDGLHRRADKLPFDGTVTFKNGTNETGVRER